MEDGNEQIKVRDVIPNEFWDVFPFEYFNEMQSSLFSQVFDSDVNMTVASPTGSGKTVVCELAVLRVLKKYGSQDIKCIMMTPNKALCQQKMNEWSRCFGPLGLSVIELTGDSVMNYSLRLVARANIIITTPEKWDAMTRSWRQHVFLLGAIDLLIVDEIHHLGEESRGATLEAVVVRMRTLNVIFHDKAPPSARLKSPMRIVSLSAALPNVSDIGEWLHCSPDSIHYFDETFRPVPLTVHTISYGSMSNMFLFERSLDNRVEEVIKRYCDGKQSLVFCSSKSGCERLSLLLSERLPKVYCSGEYSTTSSASLIQDAKLKNLVQRGHAFHHAGIPADDRLVVEQLFMKGQIQVLCATSTLAHGVNLPAHLVIIKGTNQWRGGSKGYQKMSKSMILQMTGRAGRPGYDSSGTAVIMTSREDKEFFSSLDLEVVESTLPSILTEAICAEVSQRVIQTVPECLAWLKNTFFFIRVNVNPAKYGFSAHLPLGRLEGLLEELCVRALESLQRAGIVEFNDGDCDAGDAIFDTAPVRAKREAHIMTKHMIKLKTMSQLMSLLPSASIYDIVTNVSKAEEIAKPVLRSEKKVLNDLMKHVRYPLKKLKVQEPFHKAYVLLLSAVYKDKFESFHVTSEQNNSHSVLTDFSLRVQQSEIVEQCLRLLSALFDYSVEKSKGKVLVSCLYLVRALKLQMWEEDFHVFDQCVELPFLVNARLRRENLHEIDDVLSYPSCELQKTLRCSASILQTLYSFARKEKCSGLAVSIQPFRNVQNTMMSLKVTVSTRISSTSNIDKYQSFFQSSRLFHLVVYDTFTSKLLCYRKFHSSLEPVTFNVSLPQKCLAKESDSGTEERRDFMCIDLISDQIVGQDVSTTFPSDVEASSQQESPASCIPTRKIKQKTTQSLLSFPPPTPKNIKSSANGGGLSGELSDPLPEDCKKRKRTTRAKGKSTSFCTERKDVGEKDGNRKEKKRKSRITSTNNEFNKTAMFGVFEYKPLRGQENSICVNSTDDKMHNKRWDSNKRGVQSDEVASNLPHHSGVHLHEGVRATEAGARSRRSACSNPELSLLRSKACELNLDQTPIQQACRRLTELNRAPLSPLQTQQPPETQLLQQPHHSQFPLLSQPFPAEHNVKLRSDRLYAQSLLSPTVTLTPTHSSLSHSLTHCSAATSTEHFFTQPSGQVGPNASSSFFTTPVSPICNDEGGRERPTLCSQPGSCPLAHGQDSKLASGAKTFTTEPSRFIPSFIERNALHPSSSPSNPCTLEKSFQSGKQQHGFVNEKTQLLLSAKTQARGDRTRMKRSALSPASESCAGETECLEGVDLFDQGFF